MTKVSSYIQPPLLRTGDTIGLIAPARKIAKSDIEEAVSIIRNRGYKVLFGEHLFGSSGAFSGTDAERSDDLKSMIENDDVKAIMAVRGGYGCVRIADQLPAEALFRSPKWMIGYSDLTVLHSEYHLLGIQSLHASMPIIFPENTPEALNSLFGMLEGRLPEYKWKVRPLNRNGKATGILMGGNISVLYSLLGSKTFCDTQNKILFLEDLDEYLYHLDRMMWAFKRAGKLNNLAGLVVGGLTDMHDNTVPFGKNAEEIVREIVEKYDYPVAFGLPAGHLNDNRALMLGHSVTLQVGESSRLTFNR
jgi:muramoyltetrapeptide carboxypeptidase